MAQVACTPALTAAVANTVKGGTYPEVAAALAGIDGRTFAEWIKRGEKGESVYADFLAAIRAAEALSESLATTRTLTSIQKSPASGLAFLERRFKRRWGTSVEAVKGSSGRSWMDAAFPTVGGEAESFFAKSRGEQAPGSRESPRNGNLGQGGPRRSGMGRPRRGGTKVGAEIVALPKRDL
jgi:hypothetical protein